MPTKLVKLMTRALPAALPQQVSPPRWLLSGVIVLITVRHVGGALAVCAPLRGRTAPGTNSQRCGLVVRPACRPH